MMSLVATKSGVIPKSLLKALTPRLLCASQVQVSQVQVAHKSDFVEMVDNWKKARDLFYGPERDMKNFPTIKQQADSPKLRHDFLPDAWFQYLYPKTGASGPYFLITGFLGFMCSKEYFVYDEAFQGALVSLALYVIFKSKYEKKVVERYNEYTKGLNEARFITPLQELKDHCNQDMKNAQKESWHAEGETYMFEAKKENVGLQLEAEYRQRLQNIHQAVKNRLDYQVDVVNTRKHFEQEHMVRWILDGVLKGITPQQEKESINACLQTLKGLAATAK
ncbi:hypothetical protein LOTGIDRAFT_210633 [Lottia gigantea]|uniref:ATP synthase subunit b n=1 Tax=Lottia gigantea TaxID=225164 RepID=V4BEF1_LOTGI|nr:hypothetical protein LOTGIDRAFT_210633 [Lottia gigantea]ESO87239.1 hypothetical protein LOTGIDRAFT_210633 [Lottia gigantea]